MRIVTDDKCGRNGVCPTIWQAENPDEYFVQGFIPDSSEIAEVGPPAGESLVRVPRSLLIRFAEDLLRSGELREAAVR